MNRFLSILLATVVLALAATPSFAANDQPRWSAEAEALGMWQVHRASDGTITPGPNTRLVEMIIEGERTLVPQTIVRRGNAPMAAGTKLRNCYRSSGQPRFCYLTNGVTLTAVPVNPAQPNGETRTQVGYTAQQAPGFGVIGQGRSNAEGGIFGNGPGPSGQPYWANYDELSIRSLRVYNAPAGGCELEFNAEEAGTFVGFDADTTLPVSETCDWTLIQGTGGNVPLNEVIKGITVNTTAHEVTPEYYPGKGIQCTGSPGSPSGAGICTGSGPAVGTTVPFGGPVNSTGGAFTFTMPQGVTCTVIQSGVIQPVCDRIYADDFD